MNKHMAVTWALRLQQGLSWQGVFWHGVFWQGVFA